MSSRIVSVIIANHNYKKYIANAINSVLGQNYPAIVIVVDDHSTDGSIEYINEKFDNHIESGRLFVLQNTSSTCGPAIARNIGIEFASSFTDIFGFLDADDIYLQDKVGKSVKYLEDEAIGAVYSDYENFHEDTNILIREYKEPYSRTRLLQECIINNNSLVKKEALEKSGLYDPDLRTCEDYDLWLRVSEHYLLKHIPECLIRHTTHPQNSTSSVSNENWAKNRAYVFQKLAGRQNGVIQ